MLFHIYAELIHNPKCIGYIGGYLRNLDRERTDKRKVRAGEDRRNVRAPVVSVKLNVREAACSCFLLCSVFCLSI